jgi:hypothetical protein
MPGRKSLRQCSLAYSRPQGCTVRPLDMQPCLFPTASLYRPSLDMQPCLFPTARLYRPSLDHAALLIPDRKPVPPVPWPCSLAYSRPQACTVRPWT